MAMDAIFLNLAGGDFGKTHGAEEGKQMDIQASFVALDVNGIALAFGDDFVLAEKLGGGFAEGFLFFDFAASQLAL